ncbi:MAG: hypothetical protein KDA78_08230 [Planctomycetaceae bacterium]|nr:hypothetical protein [Planctomycetaceae bacterium]
MSVSSEAAHLLDISVEPEAPARTKRFGIRQLLGGLFRLVGRFVSLLFHLASLVLLLATLAAIPIVNILALGFLLKAEGEVAREGKWKAGFPLYRVAGQLGAIVFGIFILLLPLRYLGGFTSDAYLIDPGSGLTKFLRILTFTIASGLLIHLLITLLVGGSLGSFFTPRRNYRKLRQQENLGQILRERSAAVGNVVSSLELKQTFLLGLWGALGVLMWTLIPTALFAVADAPQGPAILVTLVGGAMLAVVATWVPILQAHYSSTQRFSACRELRHCRQLFRKTPFLWTLGFLIGYALTIVLYLFKIVAPPQDALWMMTTVFIAVIYPARLLLGRIYARAARLETEPPWYWRKFWSLVSVLLCGFYVFLLFFTRNIGAHGKLVMFEQPLLLIPSPF